MASKRRIRRKSCGRKQRYENPREAIRAIGSLVRRRGPQGHLQVYRCRFCNAFHFGHAAARF